MIQKAPEIVARSPEQISSMIEELLFEMRDFTELKDRVGKGNVPQRELFRQHWLIGAMSVVDWLISHKKNGPVDACDAYMKSLAPHYAKHEKIVADCLAQIKGMEENITGQQGRTFKADGLLDRIAISILKRNRGKVDG